MENVITTILQSFEFEACMRLILAAILGGVIGYERQSWKKPAGLRTHILVAESSALVMLCGIYLAQTTNGADPSRIPAQLLSGIGFIGAGTIMRDGFHVKGLTTAASLLAVTAIGLLVGAGACVLGIIATLVVYVILSYTHIVSDAVEKYNDFNFKIYLKEPKMELKKIEKIFSREEIVLKGIKTHDDYIEIRGKMYEEISKNKLISKIMEMDNVTEVTEE